MSSRLAVLCETSCHPFGTVCYSVFVCTGISAAQQWRSSAALPLCGAASATFGPLPPECPASSLGSQHRKQKCRKRRKEDAIFNFAEAVAAVSELDKQLFFFRVFAVERGLMLVYFLFFVFYLRK